MNRRGFLQAILAAGAAPAIVRAQSLMKVSGIVIPTTEEMLRYTCIETFAFSWVDMRAVEQLAYASQMAKSMILSRERIFAATLGLILP